jgi:nucleotide-binding universal stress UspA family protein
MNILIPINGSSNMGEVLQFSKQFIRKDNVPTLLGVLKPKHHLQGSLTKSIADQAKVAFGSTSINIKIRNGKLEKEIIREIREGNYGLVIYNVSDPFSLAHKIKKPIEKHIIERGTCSVLIVRGKIGPIRKILLCDSGAEESQLLNKFTTQVVDLLDTEEDITVLHVMSQISAGPGVYGKQLRADTDELIVNHTPEGDLLERDVESLQKSGLHPTPKIRHGLVVDEILAEAQSGNYDMVVVGSHLQRWQKFLLDDLSYQIIEHVDRPILVIK